MLNCERSERSERNLQTAYTNYFVPEGGEPYLRLWGHTVVWLCGFNVYRKTV